MTPINSNSIHDKLSIVFNESDIVEAIEGLKHNSAAGPDKFPANLLYQCRQTLTKPVCMIWRESMNTGTIPSLCKFASIIPIHKGKSKAEAKNCRPVALTSLLIKLFEKVVKKHIVSFMNENQLFKNITARFQKWKILFEKQSVLVNGKKSHPSVVLSGLPQGSVLGPLIFPVPIGDIDEEVVNAFISSFADDTSAEELVPTYVSDLVQIIETKKVARDLGVQMSDDATFSFHINGLCDKISIKIAWILRTFQTRESIPMLSLCKQMVLGDHDYCSQLWHPLAVSETQSLEILQRSFLRQITETRMLSYWEQLKSFTSTPLKEDEKGT
eukprot:gene6393-7128_t